MLRSIEPLAGWALDKSRQKHTKRVAGEHRAEPDEPRVQEGPERG